MSIQVRQNSYSSLMGLTKGNIKDQEISKTEPTKGTRKLFSEPVCKGNSNNFRHVSQYSKL